ncbi:MAG: alpha/beta hydrolase [Calditrichaeota bacterium]|nr:MAG: alpha/beta hydrolase [Calditrichota bacterium]
MSAGLQTETRKIRFQAASGSEEVSAVFVRPENPRWLLVFAHGAGAGMHHPFMRCMAEALARHDIATFRYQFPYMERGRKFPDPQPVLMKTVRAAVDAAQDIGGQLPLLAGGKSLGGRMTSNAAARQPLPGVHGLVFFGFPLHAPGKPSTERAAHLLQVTVPMLFLQGTRDKLADLKLLGPLCRDLGDRAHLHIVEQADHSFLVPKKSGKSDEQVFQELALVVQSWAATLALCPLPQKSLDSYGNI